MSINSENFSLLSKLPQYVFSSVNELKSQARSRGEDIIDFGMGNPDIPTPKHIVDKLVETSLDPKMHRYSASRGISGLRKANAKYYERRFNVKLDYDKEVIATIGSKEGLANMAQVLASEGDTILVPNPAYPIHAFGFIINGANLVHYNVNAGIDLMTEISSKVESSKKDIKAMILNFPSNPTAEICSLDFYKEIVPYAKKHDIILLSDLAYADICFDGYKAPSFLQATGSMDVGVESFSLSKSYNMAGWRVGFMCGNSEVISALKRVKSYLDYGIFQPIQISAITALNGTQDCVHEIAENYKVRRNRLIDGLGKIGWEIEPPKATMFVWAKIPEKYREMGSLEFTKKLLQEAKVAVSPGIGFGEYGDDHVRFGLIENEHRTQQAARSIKKLFK